MVIDVHVHQMPPELLQRVRAGEWPGVSLQPLEGGREGMAFPGYPPAPVPPGIADVARTLRHLEAVGTDRAVLTPWVSALGDSLPPDQAVSYAQAMNAGLAQLVAQGGGRLAALGIVPTSAPEAVAAACRQVRELDLRGLFLPTHVNGAPLDAPAMEAVWQAAEAFDLPVYLHPVHVVETRLERFNLANLLGNPMDTSIAACTLIFGGVLDRHPGLRVVLSHGGGTLPYGIGRLDQGYRAARGGPLGSAHPPSAYLRRFHYDAVVYRPAALAFLVATVGADRVMLGTDHPFDMEMPEAARLAAQALSAPEAQAVCSGTAQTLFRWP
jgi:aminocarboxymuconate-semialdehyde decarboxylase